MSSQLEDNEPVSVLYEDSTWRMRFAKNKDKTKFLWGTPELFDQGDGKEHEMGWKVFTSPTDKKLFEMAVAGNSDDLNLDPGSMYDGLPLAHLWQGRILGVWMAHFGSVRTLEEYKALGPFDPSNQPKSVFPTYTASQNEPPSKPTGPQSKDYNDPATFTKVRADQRILCVLMFGTRRLTEAEKPEAARAIKRAFGLKELPDRKMMEHIINHKIALGLTGTKIFAFNEFIKWREAVRIDKPRSNKVRETPMDKSTWSAEDHIKRARYRWASLAEASASIRKQGVQDST